MPRSKVENISKGRSYKKNKPDPESSDSDTQYETISDNDDDDDDDSSYYPSSSNDSSEYCLKKHKKHSWEIATLQTRRHPHRYVSICIATHHSVTVLYLQCK